jgi:hypothetical protein
VIKRNEFALLESEQPDRVPSKGLTLAHIAAFYESLECLLLLTPHFADNFDVLSVDEVCFVLILYSPSLRLCQRLSGMRLIFARERSRRE